MLVPINITGGTYKHKSLPLSAQVTRNFWPQKQPSTAEKSSYILESFHGLKLFGSQSGGVDRGMFEHRGVLYKVTGPTLYSVSSAGVHTSLGSVSGNGRCIFDGIGANVVLVSGGVPYVWDGSTLTIITDEDLESPNGCAHLNNQILYDGDNGRFCVSDPGDETSINALNYATAESNADELLRVCVHKQIAYMLGEKTTELWWNSGTGNPPFDRVEGGIIQVGLGAVNSPASNDSYLYLLGDDCQVYALQNAVSQVVSPPTLTREISRYSTVSDAIGWCMCLEGQNFYVLTFPSADKTWLFPEGGEWFEWSSGISGGRNIANSYARAYGKHLVADYQNGNIYEVDEDTYTDNGAAIIRMRDTGPIHGGLVNKPGKRLEMNRFELILETGVGLTSGQGSDPVIMLSFSDDGGMTFSTEMWGTVGQIGQYQWKVEWFCLGSFESRIVRVKTSDPVHYSIHSAGADIEVGI